MPNSAIAQEPSQHREDSKLLVIHRDKGLIQNHRFKDLPDLLGSKWSFVRNNVKVLRARMFGQRQTGGKVECLLVHPSKENPDNSWWCLLKPSKRLKLGERIILTDSVSIEILKKSNKGIIKVKFHHNSKLSVPELSEKLGIMPLPPYIERSDSDPRSEMDNERYQTVYADPQKPFGAAAPTAGLHFTPRLIENLKKRQHQFFDLTLNVGIGTFKPIASNSIQDHKMHEESYNIPHDTVKALHTDKVLAVGTTSLRAIEDAHRKNRITANSKPIVDSANLFIYPPAPFRTDALITNFHLPKSTLLCLVSAFLTPNSTDGIDWLKQIYEAALKENYRFYSYGDAMLIL